jgi:hypothetical protein
MTTTGVKDGFTDRADTDLVPGDLMTGDKGGSDFGGPGVYALSSLWREMGDLS